MIDPIAFCDDLCRRASKNGASASVSVKGYSSETVDAIKEALSFRPWLAMTISGGVMTVKHLTIKEMVARDNQ